MLGIIGVNHNTAPISVREALAFDEHQTTDFIEKFSNQDYGYSTIVLSTCNRTEIYFTTRAQKINQASKNIEQHMLSLLPDIQKDSSFFYTYFNDDAIRHFFSVASGLESQILGEYQIVKQIKDAWYFSAQTNEIPTILSRLMDKALETSKKVRSKTTIGYGTNSVSSAAVQKCIEMFPNLSQQSFFIIGTGETGQLVLESLIKKGISNITLANRTSEKAKALAENNNLKWVKFNNLEDYLETSDIIIVSTSASEYLITGSMVNNVINKRSGKKQLYIDLSVPRNIAEDLNMIANVSLFNIDELQSIIDDNRKKKEGEIDKANKIIDRALAEHMVWLDTYHMSPTIKAIRTNLQSLNKKELENFLNHNPDTDKETLEKFSDLMVEKYTRFLVKNLKDISHNEGPKKEHIQVVDKLFDIKTCKK